MPTRVSEKGQITIPKALRKRYGIRPGQVLEVREERGRLVISKVVAGETLDSVVGILERGKGTGRLIEQMRGKPDACD